MVRLLALFLLLACAGLCCAAGQWEPRLIETSDGTVYAVTVPEWATQVYLYEDDTTYTLYDLAGMKPINPWATYFNCPKWAYPPRKSNK